MRKIIPLLLLVLVSTAFAAEFADWKITLKTTRYDLDLKPDFTRELVEGACRITVENTAKDSARVVPFLLYKLMTVHSIQDANRQELSYDQRNVMFDDMDSMQVNFIEVTLPQPLGKGKSAMLDIRYSGLMKGYVETGMLYTQDRIDPAFTILRPDCYAYPEVGVPNRQVNRKTGLESFDYALTVTVPEGMTAANAGRLTGYGTDNGRAVFTFQNIRPAWRIDAAISKYADFTRGPNKVYFFPEDAAGADRVMIAMEKCTELYTRWFGPLHQTGAFTVIEIPEGYGSQADVSGILQTADAFRDEQQLHQLYHEISHQWNVRSTDPLPCRWEEGFASFIEWRAQDLLHGKNDLDYYMDWYAGEIKKDLEKDSARAQIAPVDFGTKQIEGMSYTVGAVAFRVLWGIVGEEEFTRLLGGFYQEKEATGATAREFVSYLSTKSSIDLTNYTNDWWLGTGWAGKIKSGKTLAELVNEYR